MKRGPLKRKSELRRSAPLPRSTEAMARKKPLKARGKNYRPVSPEVRAILLARSGGCCEWCGAPFTAQNPMEPHHVEKRRHVESDDPEWMAALDRKCHDKTELFPLESHKAGVHFSAKWEAQGVAFGQRPWLIRGNRTGEGE